jgi:hypothetical protein
MRAERPWFGYPGGSVTIKAARSDYRCTIISIWV